MNMGVKLLAALTIMVILLTATAVSSLEDWGVSGAESRMGVVESMMPPGTTNGHGGMYGTRPFGMGQSTIMDLLLGHIGEMVKRIIQKMGADGYYTAGAESLMEQFGSSTNVRERVGLLWLVIKEIRESKEHGPIKRVLVIGDSITAGVISGPGDVPFTETMAEVLGVYYNVSVAGCSGGSTVDWSGGGGICGEYGIITPSVFGLLAIPKLPDDYVVVELGANDAVGYLEMSPTAPEDFRSNIEAIIENIHDNGGETVILLTPPPRCNLPRFQTFIKNLEEYTDIIKDVCVNMGGVVCGPDFYNILNATEHFDGCNVHPNQVGHYFMGLEMANFIKNLDDE